MIDQQRQAGLRHPALALLATSLCAREMGNAIPFLLAFLKF
jgi:hypothetical protein